MRRHLVLPISGLIVVFWRYSSFANAVRCLSQRRKQVFVQALVPYATIKRLDKAVLARFSGFDKLKGDASAPRPVKHGDECVRCAIIADNEIQPLV